ncbi:MAG TPA: transporter [Phycisphaerales bacterium]|nr:transporter [Phycisphaerales bacterium]
MARRLIAIAGLCGAVVAARGEPESAAPDKSGYTAVNPTPRELRRELSADRPDATESPYSVDAGAVQLEMSFAEWTLNREGGRERDTLDAAPLNLKIGLLNDVDVQIVFTPWERAEDDAGGVERGVGDFGVRVKWNLWGNDGGATALALLPFVVFPTGSDGISAEQVEGGVVVPFAMELPAGFNLGAQAGIEWVKSDDDDGTDTVFGHTVNVNREIVGPLGGFVELIGEVALDHGDYHPSLGAGLTFGVTEDVQLDAGVRLGLDNDDTDDLVVFAGVTVRF